MTGTVVLGAGETLATFNTASQRTLTSPDILITGSGASVTKSAPDGVVQVGPSGALSLASPLLAVTAGATVTTTNPALNTTLASVSAGTEPIALALTPDGTRLYVVNSEGGTVKVFNTSISIISTATNTVTGTVGGGGFGSFAALQGIVITPDGTKGYFAFNDEGSQIYVFDVATNTTTTAVTGSVNNAQRLVVSPDGTRVYASDQGGGNKVLVISTATNSIVATISVGTNPFGLAISRDGTRLYVANTSSNTVSVINTGNNAVERTISVGASPKGVALTPDGTRLLVTNSGTNTVSVVSTASLTVLTTITIGTVPADVAVNSDGTRAFIVRSVVSGILVVVDVSFGAPLLTVSAGGTIASTSSSGVTLTLGTDQPVSTNGPLIETVGATVSVQKAVVLDTALLAATAPLLNITAGSMFSTGFDAIDLLQRVKLTSVGPVVKLDASTLSVAGGALVRVGGGSLLRVTGDLVQLSNGATLNLAGGPLLFASGGSVVNVSGALIAFGGSGGNTVNVMNALCSGACPTFNEIPVFLTGGATSGQVSIGVNAIKNSSLGSVVKSSPSSTALIVVNGPTSKVTITAGGMPPE